MRAHFHRPVQNLQGDRIAEVSVRVLAPGTTDPVGDVLYVDDTSGLTRTNPWITTDGTIDFYLLSPRRVRIGITVGGDPEQFWEDVDVIAADTDSSHPGSGSESVQVGVGAVASGADSTSVGVSAAASGSQATALGHQASATAGAAVALGEQSGADEAGAIALGAAAVATGTQSLALGNGAVAPYDSSSAIGAGTSTIRPHQMVLGTAETLVDVTGTLVLSAPSGARFTLMVTETGQLMTQPLPVWVPEEQPIEGEGDGGSP